MGVIDHDLNTNIIMSIEFIKILYNSGNDVETIITALSKENFGEISFQSRNILKEMKSGLSTEDALSKAVRNSSTKNTKNLFAALVNPGPNVNQILTDLSQHIIQDKQLFISSLEQKINNYVNWILLLQAIPIVLYALEIFKGLGDFSIFDSFLFTPKFRIAVLACDAIVIFFLLFMLRGKQKE